MRSVATPGGPEAPLALVVQGLSVGKLEAGPQRLNARAGTDLGSPETALAAGARVTALRGGSQGSSEHE